MLHDARIKSAGKIEVGIVLYGFVSFFLLLQRAPVLEAWVGLRPGRPSVRLEKEVMKFKDKLGEERSLKVSRGNNNCLVMTTLVTRLRNK